MIRGLVPGWLLPWSCARGACWRNPEDDLPGDFEATRTVHYASIRQPMDPQAFITDLKQRMTNGLDRLSADGSSNNRGLGVNISAPATQTMASVARDRAELTFHHGLRETSKIALSEMDNGQE
jgi:hypothetical protein